MAGIFPPSRQLVLTSPLTPQDATAKLKSQVAPLSGWKDRIMPSGWVRGGGFMGAVNDDGSFDIRRDINYRNSFLPFIKGSITADGAGSRIDLRMAMHKAVLVFMSFWLAFTSFMLGVFIYAAHNHTLVTKPPGTAPEIGVLIPFGMLLFGLALPYVCFIPEANKAEKFLIDTLQAQKAADGKSTAL